MVANIELVFWSFCASLGFGLLFRVTGKNLFWAASGGAFSRAALLTAMHFTDNRAVYTLIAAMCASCFAKYVALRYRQPTNILLYPTIIPLIPADLLYYMMVGIILGDKERILPNALNLALGLAGMCLGFVLVSAASYYIRKSRKSPAIPAHRCGPAEPPDREK